MTDLEWQLYERLVCEIWPAWNWPTQNRVRYMRIFENWGFEDLKGATERYFDDNPDTKGPHFKEIKSLRRNPQHGTGTDDEERGTAADWQRVCDEEASRFRARWTTLGKADRDAVRTWAMESAPKLAQDAIGDATDPLDSTILRAYCSEGMRVVLDGEQPDAIESIEHRGWRLDEAAIQRAQVAISKRGGRVG